MESDLILAMHAYMPELNVVLAKFTGTLLTW